MRDIISTALGRFGLLMAKFRWIALFLVVSYTAFTASFLPDFEVSSKGIDFVPLSEPNREFKVLHEKEFGSGDYLMIIIDSKSSIFNKIFLNKLKALHDELVDHVDNVDFIDDLTNARNTMGTDDTLIVKDLMESTALSDIETAELKVLADANPLLIKRFYSDSNRYAAIVIKLYGYKVIDDDMINASPHDISTSMKQYYSEDETSAAVSISDPTHKQLEMAPQEQYDAVIAQVKDIVSLYQSEQFDVTLSGNPYFISVGNQIFGKDFATMFVLSFIVIALFLWLAFRSLQSVFIPLFVALLALISSTGIMVAISNPLMVCMATMPSFLLAAAVSGTVHIMTLYVLSVTQGDTKTASIQHAMTHSGLPVIMTSVTTAVGLYAFSFSEIPPAAEYGVLASVTTLNTLLYILILLPVLFSIIPDKHIRHNGLHKNALLNLSDSYLKKISHISTRHYKTVIFVCSCFFMTSLIAFSNISFSYDPVHWFSDDTDVVVGNNILNDEFGGGLTVELVVDFGNPGALYEPENLRILESLREIVLSHNVNSIQSSNVSSIIDIIKEIHQALNNSEKSFYKIPGNKALVTQELMLFENAGNDDVSRFTDSQIQKARMVITLPQKDLLLFNDYLTTLNAKIKSAHPELDFYIMNEVVLLSKFMGYFVDTMVSSFGVAFGVILIIMMLLFGVKIGMVSMLPNLWPIAVTLGAMCFIGLPFQLNTLLLGGTILGLAVDDTIHLIYGYRRSFALHRDPCLATQETLLNSGKAMLMTTIILSLGFLSFAFAEITMTRDVGYLAAIAILLALVADLFFVPALMTWLTTRNEAIVSPV